MVVTLLNLFVTCARDRCFADFSGGEKASFVESVVRIVTEAGYGPVAAVSNDQDVLDSVAELVGETIHDAAAPDGSVRAWRRAADFIGRYVRPGSLLASEGVLLISPFAGVVSSSRLRQFVARVEKKRPTVSADSIDRNRNPFWIRALMPPESPESPAWADINLNRLPTLTERSYYSDAFFELVPNLENICGSQWLPNLLDSDGALVYVPSGYVPTTELTDKDCVFCPVAGERDMHFLYRLGLFNIHPDEELSLPGRRCAKTRHVAGGNTLQRI